MVTKTKKKTKRTGAETAEHLGLREGNVMRSLSLNHERYKNLKAAAAEEEVSVSEIVDKLIDGYLAGRFKLAFK